LDEKWLSKTELEFLKAPKLLKQTTAALSDSKLPTNVLGVKLKNKHKHNVCESMMRKDHNGGG
jgi:hypothetical protein